MKWLFLIAVIALLVLIIGAKDVKNAPFDTELWPEDEEEPEKEDDDEEGGDKY